MQFCPAAQFRQCQIDLDIVSGKFVAKARFLTEAGWRTLLGSKERDEENDGIPLPVVAKQDQLLCEQGEVVLTDSAPSSLYRCDIALGNDRHCPFCSG